MTKRLQRRWTCGFDSLTPRAAPSFFHGKSSLLLSSVLLSTPMRQRSTFIYAPDAHFTVASLPNSPHFGQAPDPKLFILLSPGESFETLIHTGVFGAYDGAKVTAGNGLLPKGSYLLQVGVPTWPYEWPYFGSKNDTQELKQRWSKYGDLVAGLLYTDFAPFTLTQQFKNPRCH